MPLSKQRDRERKQAIAKARLDSNLNNPPAFQPAKTLERATVPFPDTHLYDSILHSTSEVPLYNPAKHQVGDTVRINGKVIKIPDLDADGQIIPWE